MCKRVAAKFIHSSRCQNSGAFLLRSNWPGETGSVTHSTPWHYALACTGGHFVVAISLAIIAVSTFFIFNFYINLTCYCWLEEKRIQLSICIFFSLSHESKRKTFCVLH